MDRRSFVAAAAAALPAGVSRAQGAPWRTYELTTTVDLGAHAGPVDLWLPLAGDDGACQRGLRRRVTTDGKARIVRDARYHAPLLAVRWDGAGPRTVTLVETVETRDRTTNPAHLSAAEQRFWTAPTASLPTDGIVGATAARITAGVDTPRARLRAIYDWVVDNTFRDPGTRGCGIGGIENMLRTGFMGGKCADINGLMVGLCRAAGIPARDAYGIRTGPSRLVKVLGPAGPDVTHAQHCRAEMWLAGEGWVPVDPADVRKVVLEAKLPVADAVVKAQRERLFGAWEMNWVAYNHATDIALPGAPRPMEEHFLMYPCAMTGAGEEIDQLSPDSFRYRIEARAV